MGKERDHDYYNQQWKGKSLASWRDYKKPRQRLFKKAAGLIPDQAPLVVDLGCGPGLFAQALDELNAPMFYYGVDFSRVAIKQARHRGIQMPHDFVIGDLSSMEPDASHIIPGTCFVIMEVLEHIEDDAHVLDLVPEGCEVVISVPQFDDPAHVRVFPTWEHVSARYAKYVEVEEHHEVWKWFIFKGKKKA